MSAIEGIENDNPLPQTTEPDTELEQEPATLSLAEFFETVPPSEIRQISDISLAQYRPGAPPSTQISTPEIQLHCGECNGTRFFRPVRQTIPELDRNFKYFFLRYVCDNCRN